MKIYILTNTIKKGGAEKQSVILAKILQSIYPTTLIVYYGHLLDEEMVKLISEYNINVMYLHGCHFLKVKKIFSIFRENKNSTIFSYLATTNTINAILGKIAGVKCRIGGIRSSDLIYWKMILQRFLHNNFLTASVFNNKAGWLSLISKGFEPQKAYIIHNAIEILEPTIYRDKKRKQIEILSVGRFVVEKDYSTALKVLKLLLDEQYSNQKSIHYTIVGYGQLEHEIRKEIQTLDLNNEVSIIINPSNLSDYYKNADIYLSTSLNEGLSNSIMEAMSFSLPIIATDVGDNSFLVHDGENGYLIPVRNLLMLSKKVKELIQNDDIRQIFGKNSFNIINTEFSCEKMKREYSDLIEKKNSHHRS
jgi:glycosyltransferase involved in cell wall biosynthesis